MSDDDARRASQALQQLAAGLDDDRPSSPQPAAAVADRGPAHAGRTGTPAARPRPLR